MERWCLWRRNDIRPIAACKVMLLAQDISDVVDVGLM
jgi:hypothetical protein